MASERSGDTGCVWREVKKWRQLERALFQEVREVEGGEDKDSEIILKMEEV